MLLSATAYPSKASSANVFDHPDLIRREVHWYFLVEVGDELVCKEGEEGEEGREGNGRRRRREEEEGE